jgi:F-type H+-transporting ATPase subunit b
MHFSNAALLSGALIDLDGTWLIQLALFFLALFLLRSLIFKPMIRLFEAREIAIDGARKEAKQMEKDAVTKADTFEDEMRAIRVKAQEERDRLRQEGLRLERSILDRVRKDTSRNLEEAEAKLGSERRRVRAEIDETIPSMARQMASRLLGRELS